MIYLEALEKIKADSKKGMNLPEWRRNICLIWRPNEGLAIFNRKTRNHRLLADAMDYLQRIVKGPTNRPNWKRVDWEVINL